MVFRISAALARARELIWGPIFGHFPQKCERFLNFCKFTLKKFEVQSPDFLCNDFLCLVWGVQADGAHGARARVLQRTADRRAAGEYAPNEE